MKKILKIPGFFDIVQSVRGSFVTTTWPILVFFGIFNTYSPRSVDCAMFRRAVLRLWSCLESTNIQKIEILPKKSRFWLSYLYDLSSSCNKFVVFSDRTWLTTPPKSPQTLFFRVLMLKNVSQKNICFFLKISSKFLQNFFEIFIGLGQTFTLKIVSWNIAQSTDLGEYVLKM